jgi:hypothetical protein
MTRFLLLSILLSCFRICEAQTIILLSSGDSLYHAGDAGTVETDSTLKVTRYAHFSTSGPGINSMDSVVCTDSTVSFRIQCNTDVCQPTTFTFRLTVDSSGVLRVASHSATTSHRVCEGVVHHTFLFTCRKADVQNAAITGVGYAGESAYVPAPAPTRSRRRR